MPVDDSKGRLLIRNPMPVHQGFWRLVIGPLPVSYKEKRQSVTDPYSTPEPETINANIKNFVAPGLSQDFQKEHHYKFSTRIPTTEDNKYNKVLTVQMFCDNRYENYWAIDRYMKTVMSGQTDGFPIQNPYHRVYGIDGRYRNRLTYVPYVEIHAGDDVAQEFMIWRFERCRFTELGDMQINPGALEPAVFNLSIQYELRRLIRLPDPNDLMTAICVANGSDRYHNYL